MLILVVTNYIVDYLVYNFKFLRKCCITIVAMNIMPQGIDFFEFTSNKFSFKTVMMSRRRYSGTTKVAYDYLIIRMFLFYAIQYIIIELCT